jgi:hypothetical protein
MSANPHVQTAGRPWRHAFGRRLILGALPLIVALGFASGLTATSPQAAAAKPVGRLSSGCYHNGRYIEHGQVIEIGGVPYVCQDGRWVLSPFLAPQDIQTRSATGR